MTSCLRWWDCSQAQDQPAAVALCCVRRLGPLVGGARRRRACPADCSRQSAAVLAVSDCPQKYLHPAVWGYPQKCRFPAVGGRPLHWYCPAAEDRSQPVPDGKLIRWQVAVLRKVYCRWRRPSRLCHLVDWLIAMAGFGLARTLLRPRLSHRAWARKFSRSKFSDWYTVLCNRKSTARYSILGIFKISSLGSLHPFWTSYLGSYSSIHIELHIWEAGIHYEFHTLFQKRWMISLLIMKCRKHSSHGMKLFIP
jgi:hypothetical protein